MGFNKPGKTPKTPSGTTGSSSLPNEEEFGTAPPSSETGGAASGQTEGQVAGQSSNGALNPSTQGGGNYNNADALNNLPPELQQSIYGFAAGYQGGRRMIVVVLTQDQIFNPKLAMYLPPGAY